MLHTGFSQLPVVYWTDIIDILVVAFIIYKAISLLRETRAEQLVKGIVFLLIFLQLSYWFKLNTINFIIRNVLQFGVIALLIVFQPELRRALEKMGRSRLGNLINFEGGTSSEAAEQTIDALFFACRSMSADKVGALIVVERDTKLGEIINTGVSMECQISWEILVNIFVPNTPLHDGAVIVRDNKIMAAGCFLPLTENPYLSTELGTRHRAAIGMSENSDAISIVVSEETGTISVAVGGKITRDLSPNELKNKLRSLLKIEEEETGKKRFFKWRRKGQ